jgi:tetratricopeptide (TPR) repeat protein
MAAVVVLGMHRSGTSCLAGMLAAGGLASAGEAVRNWDNARGHHEMLDVVRLNEAVLAYGGGHWLSPPPTVRWTDAHAAERDRILAARIDGRPALLKDPRMLLTLPFWRASSVPFHAVGIVRHPLSVARSLESWRGTPLDEGVGLWIAHNRALAEDRAAFGYPLVSFDRPRDEVVAQVIEIAQALSYRGDGAHAGSSAVDAHALAAAFEEPLVHHDAGEAPQLERLDEALALHRALVGDASSASRAGFPRAALSAFRAALDAGRRPEALRFARAALSEVADASAVLVPVVAALSRARAFAEARALVAEQKARLDGGLGALLDGKLLLSLARYDEAVERLEAATRVAHPFFQARLLLPQALRGAGRAVEAREALRAVAGAALHPHGPLSTLAEWSAQDGDRAEALAWMAQAIASAPAHRRGRLRARRAEWLLAAGERSSAREELERGLAEDPSYARSRALLEALCSAPDGARARGRASLS